MNKFLCWLPRILTIAFLCFLALFSLDVITPEANYWQIAVGLLMHNIPVFILLIVLLISWKHEIVGGIVFTVAGLFFMLQMLVAMSRSEFEWADLSQLIIAGPALLIGVLFTVNWARCKINRSVDKRSKGL